MSDTTSIPKMELVTSTNLHSVGHDGDALYVRFKGAGGTPGKLYRYPTAGAEHHAGLIAAASPGSYFADRVKHFHRGEPVAE